MKSRDDWYVAHMQIFEDLNKAIKDRYEMIERAVETERKSQHMSRAFNDRMEEMVQARSDEKATQDAEAQAASEETASIEVVESAPEEAAPDEAESKEAESEEDESNDEAPAASWGDGEDPWSGQ